MKAREMPKEGRLHPHLSKSTDNERKETEKIHRKISCLEIKRPFYFGIKNLAFFAASADIVAHFSARPSKNIFDI